MCVSTDVAISNYLPTNTLLPAASCWLLNYGKERILGGGKKKSSSKSFLFSTELLKKPFDLHCTTLSWSYYYNFFLFFYSAVVCKSSVVWPKCWVLTALILLYLSPTVLLTWQGHWKEKKNIFFFPTKVRDSFDSKFFQSRIWSYVSLCSLQPQFGAQLVHNK